MKRGVLLIVALLIGFHTFSQIHIVPKVGMNFSSLNGDLGYYAGSLDQRFVGDGFKGFSFGVEVDYTLSDLIVFAPEIIYSNKGGMFETPDPTKRILEYHLNYIEIPLVAKISPSDLDPFKLYGIIGPYLGFLTGGNGVQLGPSWDTRDEPIKDFFANSDNQSYKGMDIGLCLGAGAGFNIGDGSLNLDIKYEIGFIGVSGYSEQNLYKPIGANRNLSIMLGYSFLVVSE